jgi:hypothetical protein
MYAHSLKGSSNGFTNAPSSWFIGFYAGMHVSVLDGIFNRAVCKEHGNYSEGFNFQNCFKKFDIREVIKPKYSH